MITSVTFRAFPSAKFVTATVVLGTVTSTDDAYWDAITYVLSRFPELDDQGISGYTAIATNLSGMFNISIPVSGFLGSFMLPLLHPSNSSDSLGASLNKVIEEAKALHPGEFFSSVTTATYDSFWDWYESNNGPLDAGQNQVLGSRLLDGKALANREGLKKAYKTITSDGTPASLYLISGKKVWNSDVRGGSNAVNPGWRRVYVHSSKLSR